jgi:hypothetical protein
MVGWGDEEGMLNGNEDSDFVFVVRARLSSLEVKRLLFVF